MLEDESKTTQTQDSDPINPDEQQRQTLLRIARQVIEQTVNDNAAFSEEKIDQQLQQKAAVFVTLWKGQESDSQSDSAKQLRGCIGRLQPDFPLHLAVKNAAISAATRDPRFPPVQPDELESLAIEIAILSPLTEVHSLEEIVIGRDGIVIESMGHRGLLLPKVASRLNWDRSEFLRSVCLKAGLPENTWPENGRLCKFRTVVFHE